MLRIDNKQISIFEYMLPEELKKLPDELAAVEFGRKVLLVESEEGIITL